MKVDEERRLAARDWATQAAAEVTHLERRATWGKRITRVQTLVVEIVERAAVKLVGARLCEDLDVAEADAVVLGVEWVLVDAHFANRLFRRHTAAGETVDKDLAAVWTSRWAS